MLKWISLVIVIIGVVLYLAGALEVDNSTDSVDISIDKEKTQALKEKIQDKLEE